MTACPTCGADREHRSKPSHDHYFAAVQNAFDNLPEDMAGDFPSVEHLRKWALVKAGWGDMRLYVARDSKEAANMARFMRPMDTYAIVRWIGRIIYVHTAKSQSLKAMSKAEFQKSKEDVLRVLSELLGVDVAELKRKAA